jgi:EAL domain-containing protein (putative c-di-GMP-specific phosphodiesterase class I)
METKGTYTLENSITFGDWIPKKVVQDFFNYGDTKMSTFSLDYNIRTSKVGKRIFYKYNDIIRLINENIQENNY